MRLENGKLEKAYKLSVWSLYALILFILGLGLYVLWPVKWIEYYNSPFPVKTKDIEGGEVLIYDVHYCRFNDKPATFSKDIIALDNSVGVSLPSYDSSFGTNCDRKDHEGDVVEVRSTIVPKQLPVGEYRMKMTVEQQVNILRKESFSVETESFKIIEH